MSRREKKAVDVHRQDCYGLEFKDAGDECNCSDFRLVTSTIDQL